MIRTRNAMHHYLSIDFFYGKHIKSYVEIAFFFYLFEYGNCIFFGSGDFDP